MSAWLAERAVRVQELVSRREILAEFAKFTLAFEKAATIVRAVQLAVLFAPCVLTAPVLLYGPWGDWATRLWYVYFNSCISNLRLMSCFIHSQVRVAETDT